MCPHQLHAHINATMPPDRPKETGRAKDHRTPDYESAQRERQNATSNRKGLFADELRAKLLRICPTEFASLPLAERMISMPETVFSRDGRGEAIPNLKVFIGYTKKIDNLDDDEEEAAQPLWAYLRPTCCVHFMTQGKFMKKASTSDSVTLVPPFSYVKSDDKSKYRDTQRESLLAYYLVSLSSEKQFTKDNLSGVSLGALVRACKTIHRAVSSGRPAGGRDIEKDPDSLFISDESIIPGCKSPS